MEAVLSIRFRSLALCFLAFAVLSGFFNSPVYARKKKQHKKSYLDYAPFPRKEYENSKKYYRCAASAKSTDADIAHDKALAEAKTRLIKAVLNAYDDNVGNDTNGLKQLPLPDLKIIDETLIPGGGHMDTYWILIAVKRKFIRDYVSSQFEKLDVEDIDTKQFMKKFDKEMEDQKFEFY